MGTIGGDRRVRVCIRLSGVHLDTGYEKMVHNPLALACKNRRDIPVGSGP